MSISPLFNKRSVVTLLLTIALTITSLLPGSALTADAPYTIDLQLHTITVRPTGDATTNLNSALAYLINRSDKNIRWTMKVPGGKYVINKHLYADKLENVSLVSDRSNPAIIMKAPGYTNEFLFYSRYSKNISISGFQFYGNTNFATNADPVWEDQGLYFASSRDITIDKNRFHNFGNAAVRITTSENDPVTGVNSFNTSVINNYFNNIYQVTTTSNSQIHGATSNYLFQNNNFVNLRGSVKFASRTPGAINVKVINNSILGSSLDGFEISSYSNLELSYNRIENVARNAINCYTNNRALPGFAWGDNLVIKANTITNAGAGIRFSPEPYADGIKVNPKNVIISNNTLSNITGYTAAISIVNGTINGLTITQNKLSNIVSKKYFNIANGSTNVNISGNYVDNKIYTASN